MIDIYGENSETRRDNVNQRSGYFLGFAWVALGSVASIYMAFFAVRAFLFVATKRFALSHNPPTYVFAVICATYTFAIVSTSILNGAHNLHQNLGLAMFLAPLHLGSRFVFSDSRKLLGTLIIGAAFGSVFIAPIASYQYFFLNQRAEGFSGNAGVFSVSALLLGALGCLTALSPQPKFKLLGSLSALAMAMSLFTSEMRGMWLAALIVLPILGLLFWKKTDGRRRKPVFIGIFIVVVAISASFGDRIVARIMLFQTDLQKLETNQDYSTSTGLRLVMLEAGFSAAAKSPLIGYGIGNRMTALRMNLDPKIAPQFPRFSHPHNGFLAALLDAGIFGLLTSIAMLVAPPVLVLKYFYHAPDRDMRFASALILSITFVGSGMTNILFQHDIMDSLFIGVALFILGGKQSLKTRNDQIPDG